MSAAYATFGLAQAMRAGGVRADGGYQLHRDFTDFVVDGSPLLHQFCDLDGGPNGACVVAGASGSVLVAAVR